MKARLLPTPLQRGIIDALEWCERSNLSITLAFVLAFLVVLIGLVEAYQQ